MNKSAHILICESLSGKIFQGTRHLGKGLYLYDSFISPDSKILFYDITGNYPESYKLSINDLSFLNEISKEEAKKINPDLEQTLEKVRLREFSQRHKVL